MPQIYVSKQVKKDLYRFINRSRLSPEFSSPKKFNSPSQAIDFLLKIGLKYPLNYLENLAKLPYIESSMSVEDWDNEEVRDRKILEEFSDGS